LEGKLIGESSRLVSLGRLAGDVCEAELAGAIPVPTRVVVWGEPVALSATERAAEKPLTPVGVKVM